MSGMCEWCVGMVCVVHVSGVCVCVCAYVCRGVCVHMYVVVFVVCVHPNMFTCNSASPQQCHTRSQVQRNIPLTQMKLCF